MIPALCGVVLGLAVGWFARGRMNKTPRGYAVLCGDLDTAALVWKPGTRVYFLDQYGAQALSEGELNQALAERLSALRKGR